MVFNPQGRKQVKDFLTSVTTKYNKVQYRGKDHKNTYYKT